MKKLRIHLIILAAVFITSYAQNNSFNNYDVYVDKDGVMRWKNTNEEVSLFGVNYTTPFAYSYRAHKKLGLSIKKAIDLDVKQMVRLKLDAFRVHVWDREISDKNGNVINNEHLDLFDYLLNRLAENGIKIILTPIAWWGNGWPEPDKKTDGFSEFYSKLELITNTKAREAQRNYLKQFINHVNPYRNVSYKNDSSIIAVEIINEPSHPKDEKETTDYINDMVKVLRDEGFTKPIFYNISQNWRDNKSAQAVVNANIDGVSFQWYPTDLVHNKMLYGNYLINVNHYSIPSAEIVGFNNKAKMVYEFDAADVGGSFMYPAMARSFREAGMQFATMFSYDPTQIAWSNTEYPTHFLNLLYTPSKAISLMIAAEAFRRLPRFMSYGDYPDNNRFGDVSINYEENLSELKNDSIFYYTSNTKTVLEKPALLKHIAGTGNSSVIKYDGTGAYFLDKLENGIWRLEVYPDVLWLRDPFEQTSLSRQVAHLYWNKRKMSIALSDLSQNFTIISLTSSNKISVNEKDKEFFIEPGYYLLASKDIDKIKIHKYANKKEKFLDGLFIPRTKSPAVKVVNNTPFYVFVNDFKNLRFQIAAEKEIEEALLYIKRLGWRRFEKYPLKNIGGFDFVVDDSIKILTPGELEYCVTVKIDNELFTFPDGAEGSPENWDFYSEKLWKLKILDIKEPIVLFDASRDRKDIVFPQFSQTMRYWIDYRNGFNSNNNSLFVRVNLTEENKIPFGFQFNTSKIIKPLKNNLNKYESFLLRARADSDSSLIIKIIFVNKKGKCFQTEVDLNKDWKDYEIPIKPITSQSFNYPTRMTKNNFKEGSSLILPFSYPLFLPKIWNSAKNLSDNKFNIDEIEFLQILIENKNSDGNRKKLDASFEIESLIIK